MDRLEEIKERLHNFKTAPRDGEPKGLPLDTMKVIGIWADNAPADIEYLLQRLEIAQKALEKISGHEMYPAGIAIRALEQLKEDSP